MSNHNPNDPVEDGAGHSAPVPSPRLERVLSLFTEVRSGEAQTGVLLLINVLLVMVTYYLVKPLREGWLSVTDIRNLSKIEIKAYSSLLQSMVLMVVVPLYAIAATRLPRRRLITRTTAFFMVTLVIFWFQHPDHNPNSMPWIAITFYLFVGILGVTLVSQFWAFAADLYSVERGTRLFPLIGIGATAGATIGSWISQKLVRLPMVDSYDLLLVAILPLIVALITTWAADRRGQTGRARFPERRLGSAAPGEASPYRLIFQTRYLFLAAMLAMFINWVNSNGENILFGLVQENLLERANAEGILEKGAISQWMKEHTTSFFGDLYFWVNLLSLVMQAFLASRLVKYGGFAAVLFLTPLVSMFSYGLMALFPALAVIRFMKIMENSSNYSMNNTARHLLWLPTSPTMIYKAKAAVDTVFVRLGDGLAALTILLATRAFSASLTSLLVFNFCLVLGWGGVAWLLARENARLHAALPATDGHPLPAES